MLNNQQKRVAISLRDDKPDPPNLEEAHQHWRKRVYDERELLQVSFEDWKEFEAIAGVNE